MSRWRAIRLTLRRDRLYGIDAWTAETAACWTWSTAFVPVVASRSNRVYRTETTLTRLCSLRRRIATSPFDGLRVDDAELAPRSCARL